MLFHSGHVTTNRTEQIDQELIETLPVQQQLELVARITQRLTRLLEQTSSRPQRDHSIMELHGLGARQWVGVDAQSFVYQLRQEWDEPAR